MVPFPALKAKGAKDEEVEKIISDISNILRNSPSGTGFSIHLVACEAVDTGNLVPTVQELFPTLAKIKEKIPTAKEYRIATQPKMAYYGHEQMSVPPGKMTG
jgi:hypothetical protein